ncbi:MAG: transketolase [Chlorobiaceae bacterium]|nr:transketolase [Chlorobiaceae bacterium]
MSRTTTIVEAEAITTVRLLAVDMVEKANSGHPGLPLGAAPMACALFTKIMRHNPANPSWLNRDRFVLSAGHGSALLYPLLHLCGYDLGLDELKAFRQLGSRTPGHPEYGHTPGVEITTGPLGQGIAAAVGMALAERLLAARLNTGDLTLIDYHTYVICSDGDLMEGLSSEASSLAGHLKLGKLICLYDDNGISIEGSTKLTFTENVRLRYEAYGWHVDEVDGNDQNAIEKCVRNAKAQGDRPSMILVHTTIGYGSPNKAGKSSAHGEPLGASETRLLKQRFGVPEDQSFVVSEAVREHFRQAATRGAALEADWQAKWSRFKAERPEFAGTVETLLNGGMPQEWLSGVEPFEPGEPLATRQASKTFLGALAGKVAFLIGGSADLGPSTGTGIAGAIDVTEDGFEGFNIHFGIREHAMAAMMNGIALSKIMVPYGGTFLVFADYMKPAIRMACLMQLHVVYIFTHDSIGVGEDGPTHQPIEQLAMLRAIPGLDVIRPADANETLAAWKLALSRRKPVALVLSRQSLPRLDAAHMPVLEGTPKGAYILSDWDDNENEKRVILIATGSEVHPALSAKELLENEGIAARIVSMPCRELFREMPDSYREEVLPSSVRKRVVIEAASPFGWDGVAGPEGCVTGLDRFGVSAPGAAVFELFGFTGSSIAEVAKGLFQAKGDTA